MDKQLLTIQEASELLGVHRNSIRNWIMRGELPARRQETGEDKRITGRGVRWLINETDLMRVWADKSASVPVYRKRLSTMLSKHLDE